MSQPKVITITLNPSLDRTLTTHYLAQGYHNRLVDSTRLDPAGEGVSISRALHRLAFATHALILLGNDPVGKAYEALIQGEAFPITVLRAEGNTRSDTIILDTGKENETHLIEDCTTLNEETLQRVQTTLQTLIRAGDFVVLAGSLPPNSPHTTYSDLMETAQTAGAKKVVAVGAPELSQALQANPDLVALTQLQAEVYFNFPVRSAEDVAFCARQLRAGGAEEVLVEMQETGDVFLTAPGGEWMLDLPEFESGTSSGVWEALLAGFVAGRLEKQSDPGALELGAAAALYTAHQVGSEFGSLADLRAYMQVAQITPVEIADPAGLKQAEVQTSGDVVFPSGG